MTLKTAGDYQALIPWQNASQPDFRAVVGGQCQPHVDEQAFLDSLPLAFDLDVAIGVQLDIVGQWVGVSRQLPVPAANLYFALGVEIAGLGRGYWKGPYDQGVLISALDDDTYRRLLRSRILANRGLGTPASAQTILASFFSTNLAIGASDFNADFTGDVSTDVPTIGTTVIVQDNSVVSTTRSFFSLGDAAKGLGSTAVWFNASLVVPTIPEVDMSIIIGIAGIIPSVLELEVLIQGLLPVVASGVRQDIVISSVNDTPLFGLGVENSYIAGLGVGSIGINPVTYINNVTGAAA